MKPLAVVLSDLHLRSDGRTLPNRPEPKGDIEYSMSQVFAYLKDRLQESVPFSVPLMLAGDTFDTKLCHASMISLAQRLLSPFRTIYYVQGQHDETSPPWPSLIHPQCHWIHRHGLRIDNHYFVGFDYFYSLDSLRKFLDHMVKSEPYVLVTHYPFLFHPESLDLLGKYSNIKMVISGDYHVPTVLPLSNGALFYSVGAMHPNKLDDTNRYSFMVLFDDNGQLKVETVPLQTRAVLVQDVVNEADLESLRRQVQEILDTYPEPIRKPLVTARCSEPGLIVQLRDALSDSCWLFIRPYRDVTAEMDSPSPASDQDSILVLEDLKSVLKQYHLQRMGDKYVNIISGLFESCRTAGSPRTALLRRVIHDLHRLYTESQTEESKHAN